MTPFLLFASCEIVFVWPSAIYAQITELSPDAYPALVITLAFIAFLLGYLIFNRVLGYHSAMPGIFLNNGLTLTYPRKVYFFTIAAFALFLCAAGLYLYQGIPPFIKAVTGLIRGKNPQDMISLMSEARKYITKAHYFGGAYRGQGLIREVMSIGWPYLFALSALICCKTKKLNWAALSCILFAGLFIFIAGDGTRAPFLWSLIYLVIVASLVIKLNWRSMTGVIAALFVCLTLISVASPKLYSVLGKKGAVATAGKNLADRIFLGNGLDNIYVMEFIRSGKLQYRGGNVHLQKALNSIPGIQSGTPFSRELNQLIHPGKKSTSYSSMTYIGTIYVDFGLLGVIIVYFLLGVMIAFSELIIFTRKKSLTELPLLAFAVIYLGRMSFSGPIGFGSSFIAVYACYLMIKFLLEVQYAALSPIKKEALEC